MRCNRCGKENIVCSRCGETIIADQVYICDDADRIIKFGHSHAEYLCGKNHMTNKMFDDLKNEKNRPESAKDWHSKIDD